MIYEKTKCQVFLGPNSPIKVPVSLSRYSILPPIFYFFNTIPIAGGVRCSETFASIMILHLSNFITFVKMKQFVLFFLESWLPNRIYKSISILHYIALLLTCIPLYIAPSSSVKFWWPTNLSP